MSGSGAPISSIPKGRFNYEVTLADGNVLTVSADSMACSGGGVEFSVNFGSPTGFVVIRVFPPGAFTRAELVAVSAAAPSRSPAP